jgi:hypothetical protein
VHCTYVGHGWKRSGTFLASYVKDKAPPSFVSCVRLNLNVLILDLRSTGLIAAKFSLSPFIPSSPMLSTLLTQKEAVGAVMLESDSSFLN